MQVAIVGGGIGGLALGVALKHWGIPYTIYERDESFAQ
jgi:2-polyprenyl-6-methoxyphenol hydroxylase-like FAD-dependent oxidoreductase